MTEMTDDTNPIYNIDFVSKLRDKDDDDYEKLKIMNKIDKAISGKTPFLLFHMVPIFYTMTFICGISVFIYKIMI